LLCDTIATAASTPMDDATRKETLRHLESLTGLVALLRRRDIQ
jgi:hypothetical protein